MKPGDSDTIRLTGIVARGSHGVFEWERRRRAVFTVDVICELDREPDAGDDLGSTLDYGALAADVVRAVEGPSVQLIETLADRIAAACLAYRIVRRAHVTVHKPEAPMPVPVGDVAVTVVRNR